MTDHTQPGDSGAPRKPRSFRATESEWRLIRAHAKKAGLSASRYLLERALEPAAGGEPVGALPAALLKRFATDVRALAIAERWRFEAADATGDWTAIVAEARREIEREPDRG